MNRRLTVGAAIGILLTVSLLACGGGRGTRSGVTATYRHYYGPNPWRYGRDRVVVVPEPEAPDLEAVPLPMPEPEIPDIGLDAMPMGFPD